MDLQFDKIPQNIKNLMVEALTHLYKGMNGVEPKAEDVKLDEAVTTVKLHDNPPALEVTFGSKHYNVFVPPTMMREWTITRATDGTAVTLNNLINLLNQAGKTNEEIVKLQKTLDTIITNVYSTKADAVLAQFTVVKK